MDIQWGRELLGRVIEQVLAMESNLNLIPFSTTCWLEDLTPPRVSTSLSVQCR